MFRCRSTKRSILTTDVFHTSETLYGIYSIFGKRPIRGPRPAPRCIMQHLEPRRELVFFHAPAGNIQLERVNRAHHAFTAHKTDQEVKFKRPPARPPTHQSSLPMKLSCTALFLTALSASQSVTAQSPPLPRHLAGGTPAPTPSPSNRIIFVEANLNFDATLPGNDQLIGVHIHTGSSTVNGPVNLILCGSYVPTTIPTHCIHAHGTPVAPCNTVSLSIVFSSSPTRLLACCSSRSPIGTVPRSPPRMGRAPIQSYNRPLPRMDDSWRRSLVDRHWGRGTWGLPTPRQSPVPPPLPLGLPPPHKRFGKP